MEKSDDRIVQARDYPYYGGGVTQRLALDPPSSPKRALKEPLTTALASGSAYF